MTPFLPRRGIRNEMARIAFGVQRHAAHLHGGQDALHGAHSQALRQRCHQPGTQARREYQRSLSTRTFDPLCPDGGLFLRFLPEFEEQRPARRACLGLGNHLVQIGGLHFFVPAVEFAHGLMIRLLAAAVPLPA
jgi:hypothetical protein